MTPKVTDGVAVADAAASAVAVLKVASSDISQRAPTIVLLTGQQVRRLRHAATTSGRSSSVVVPHLRPTVMMMLYDTYTCFH